jgi:hypothetical protein
MNEFSNRPSEVGRGSSGQGQRSMKLSTDRILTTHAGSMPRGEPLGSMLIDQEVGKRIDR